MRLFVSCLTAATACGAFLGTILRPGFLEIVISLVVANLFLYCVSKANGGRVRRRPSTD